MSNALNKENIKQEVIELLRTLVEVPSVTGFEDSVREKIIELLQPTDIQISTDNIGNLYATAPGIENKESPLPHIMVCAHMDEVGFIVSNIDEEGFIYLFPLGGIPEYLGAGEWVSLHTDRGIIQGGIGIHPPHLPFSGTQEFFVDVGAQNREQVQRMGISVGTAVTFSHNFHQLNKNRVMARCLDNRVGCAILIVLLQQISANRIEANVTGVFSSTEEHGMLPGNNSHAIGSRGALVAAMKLQPDFSIIVDSIVCSDIPGIPSHMRQICLGKGVALRLVDDLAIMRQQMRMFLKNIAVKENIHIQEGISRSYTDASVIQLADVPVATLGIPLRYAHSPAQIADLDDIMQTLHFINAIIKKVAH